MKSSRVVVFSLLLFVFSIVQATSSFAELIESISLDASLGYRVDQLDWNIAGNYAGSNPNVLSELTWSDLEILQLQLDSKIETRDLLWLKTNTLFVGKFAYGKIFVGENRDSDYALDNRSAEWSRSENQSDDGYTLDVSGAFGPKYELVEDKLFWAPLLGYSVNIQNLEITEGVQTVSNNLTTIYFPGGTSPAPLGPIANLDSSYMAFWYGPWLGAHFDYYPREKWNFNLTAEYHLVEYFAEANWNLRPNLAKPVSFDHEAKGYGFVLAAKSAYEINQHWALLFSGQFQSFRTEDGVDTVYFVNGSRGGTRLNEVNWDSYALMFGLRYHF
jgi:hypothetical protein